MGEFLSLDFQKQDYYFFKKNQHIFRLLEHITVFKEIFTKFDVMLNLQCHIPLGINIKDLKI